MKIRTAETKDRVELVALIARFRQALVQLRKKEGSLDLASAKKELADYQGNNYPIYVSETDQGRLVGYLVCRVEEKVVWAESLFVLPEYRRRGIGSRLYAKAEALADELGGETLYNWVDPTNTRIISFLKVRGYNVLNLVEIRRSVSGESMNTKVRVGENEFDHY